MKIVPARKGGRCFNANHLDAGIIIHAVPVFSEHYDHGYWGGKSLCGTEPGKRSYGWSESDKEINCEKCLKKIKNTNQP